MKKNKKATSIIEAIIMILILLIGILGLFNIYIKSQQLSTSTKYKIQAIEIAREGIEAMENIRNTNWILLGADKTNCWNTLNYDNGCVGKISPNLISTGMYKIYTDTKGKWLLNKYTGTNSKDYKNSSYRNFFRINKDSKGLYTQSGGIKFMPIFTREINITYSGTSEMNLKSIVMWADSHGSGAHIVELDNALTNWRK